MTVTINKKDYEVSGAMLEMRLVEFLRDELGLTGVKNACDIGACGACTTLIDDKPVKICHVYVEEVVGTKILTIEGMACEDGTLHPLQRAFIEAGAIQCGFCTPGMVLAAHALLSKNDTPSREEIRHALKGNLCRCTGYQQIIDAVERAAPFYRSQ
jgi:carbon-monoxide dehydrogenase small subunit